MLLKKWKRLWKSGCIARGIEHLLVMLPATLVVAKYMDTPSGALVTLPVILVACGIATFLFSILFQPKVPFFLGPSISYIGFLGYQAAKVGDGASIDSARTTILLGYMIAGATLFLLSFLYHNEGFRRGLNMLLPNTVMGPAISLIGLQMASTAARDAGFTSGNSHAIILSLVTLGCIIVVSLVKLRPLRDASILVGVLAGCVVAAFMGELNWPEQSLVGFSQPMPWFPSLSGPLTSDLPTLLLSVLPPTAVIFLELHGRMLVFEGMLRRDGVPLSDYEASSRKTFRQNILQKHAGATMLSTLVGIVPCTIYAENLALMNLHDTGSSSKSHAISGNKSFKKRCKDPLSPYPYRIAALICMAAIFFKGIQEILAIIPTPVFGGMELFLFGLIAAPGIQVLVEERVDYKKVSNQIVTASVLIAGIGEFPVPDEMKGMSLGLIVGMVVNLLVLFMKKLGWLKEDMTLAEVLDIILEGYGKRKLRLFFDLGNKTVGPGCKTPEGWKTYIHEKSMRKKLRKVKNIVMEGENDAKPVRLWMRGAERNMTIWLDETFASEFASDYGDRCRIILKPYGEMDVTLDDRVTEDILRKLLENRAGEPHFAA